MNSKNTSNNIIFEFHVLRPIYITYTRNMKHLLLRRFEGHNFELNGSFVLVVNNYGISVLKILLFRYNFIKTQVVHKI